MKKIWFFFLFLIFILFPFSVFAGHACNERCGGAANITCNETTGTLSYNQGSCNSGLACYSGAGNVCRNPYCPTRTDCRCPNFTIQGFKQPNWYPFSGQTISLDGGSPTTEQPYFFRNVAANTIHRVSASSPPGSSVGYTLCYNDINCHSNPPTSRSFVYICTNNPGTTNYADLWWHYKPLIPNCKNIRVNPVSPLVGDTVTITADYENFNGPVTSVGMVVGPQGSCFFSPLNVIQSAGAGTYSFQWTPTSAGNYDIFCRAWNATIAECRGMCVDGPPRYSCLGPNAKITVTVFNRTPTPTPTPTLYPTVAISGNLREYLGALCFNNISTSNLSLNINPQYSAGITSACGITPPTGQTKYSYRCTVVFDNQRARPIPVQNLSLSASANGYSFGYWSNPNNTCTTNYNNVITVNVSSGGSTVYNKDIYFSLTTPWIKIKDSSFSKIGSLTNIVPLNIIAYDADDNANRYFIINNGSPPQTDPGLVSAASINTGTANVSSKNWWVASYSRIVSTSPQLFLDYVRSRKEYQTIADLSSITNNGLYVWQGDLTLTNTNLNQITASNLVLIVNGNLSINENQFNIGSDCLNTSTSKKIALLSTGAINFSNNTQCAAGIFIGQTIDTGSNNNQGLKIKGNLVAFSSFNNQRRWSDNSKPAVFIIFQSQMYLDLLPYLSVSKYDWRQLQ